MNKIEEKFLNFIKNNNLIKSGESILVSFSGGADSIFLLTMLTLFKKKLNIKDIALFHLNHSLRGDESTRDQIFSHSVAKKHNIRIFSETLNVKNFSIENKMSIEAGGRLLRYQLLKKISSENGYDKIATAHNFDDQIENFFISLFRGRGITAFEGIKLKFSNIIRPIITFKKLEILQYLKESQTQFVEDSSNRKNYYLRNRIRNILIPFISENFSPAFEKHISNFSQNIGELSEFIEDSVSSIFDKIISPNNNGYNLLYKQLPMNRFIRFEIYKKIFAHFNNYNYRLSVLTELDKFIHSSKGVFTFQKIQFYKEYDNIFISLKNSKNIDGSPTQTSLITGIGEYAFKNFRLKIESVDSYPQLSEKGHLTEFFDFEKLLLPLEIRYYKGGERFQPLGIGSPKKLKDFFINSKIPLRKRREIPLLVDSSGEIVWVVGHRISEKVKISKESKNYLKTEIDFY